MYDKKIAYLHYIKDNGLMGNAGHAKLMQRGSSMSLEIYVRDMQKLVSGYYSFKGLGECEFEDKIHIERGQAVYKKRLDVDKMLKNRIPCGIRIDIGENEYLEAIWQSEKSREPEIAAAEKQDITEMTATKIREIKKEPEAVNVNSTYEEMHKDTESNPYGKQTGILRKNNCEKKNEAAGQENAWSQLTFSVPVEMYEDKWKELCKKYEVIYPFGNKDAYISIGPKDFIIFPEKYQNLVNNSFLLHGYYNYQHIILGRKEESGKGVYYLGVPGVYYEREKMVAIMFGFEGFECGNKRATSGGFGYYMRRVEL